MAAAPADEVKPLAMMLSVTVKDGTNAPSEIGPQIVR